MSTHPTLLKLGPEDLGRTLSAEEYARAEFQEPWSFERVEGRLIAVAPEGQRHIEGTSPWLKRLAVYWSENPGVVDLVVPGAWVRPDVGTDRIGDIGVYLVAEGPQPPIPDRVPDLMFEIVSPGRASRDRDYREKPLEYARLGIREYVIVDRQDQAVTVLQLVDRHYRKRVLGTADTYTSPLLPGLVIPLAEVL